MAEVTDRRYPLHWPAGWKRSKNRARSRYQTTEERSRVELIKSLQRMEAGDIILSTNVPLRQDGYPYVNRPRPSDPGVAVYWTLRGRACCMACDKWLTVGENIRALGLAVEALRQLSRCGASEIIGRAFTGFAALPETSGVPNWRVELGFTNEDTPTATQINIHYRARAKDASQNEENLLRLNQARAQALAEIGES